MLDDLSFGSRGQGDAHVVSIAQEILQVRPQVYLLLGLLVMGLPHRAGMTLHSDTPLVWSTISTGPARDMINEWERLRRKPATLRHVNNWPFLPRVVSDLDEVLELAGFGRAIDDVDGDQLLWHLVREGEHDDIAARIVLHRILPPLMAMAKRRGRVVQGGAHTAMVDVLATAWFVIRSYPHHRRHHKVAANLVRDIEYNAFVRHHRLRHVDEHQVGDDVLHQLLEDSASSSDGLALVMQDASEMGVDEKHITLLREFSQGKCNDDVAESLGISSRTVRNYKRNAIIAIQEAYEAIEKV